LRLPLICLSDFAVQGFVDQLHNLIMMRMEAFAGLGFKDSHYLTRTDINSASDIFREHLRLHQAQLGHTWSMSIIRSPKRRSPSVSSDFSSDYFTPSKRSRLSPSLSVDSVLGDLGPESPFQNGVNGMDTSFSPSSSCASLARSDSSVVTVSMLRALTRDMMKKYGSPPST
jgi:nuclear mRNA export protein SAC3